MRISLIAAISSNDVIGYENRLPWYLPEDLKNFKKLTMGKPILMGRKTYQSLPGLLSGRTHIIVTRNPKFEAKGCHIFSSIPDALRSFEKYPEIMVIGGASFYAQMIEHSTTMYITKINQDFRGDRYFPVFDISEWFEKSRKDLQQLNPPFLKYSFRVYGRRTHVPDHYATITSE